MTQFSIHWILSLNRLCQKWGQVQTATTASSYKGLSKPSGAAVEDVTNMSLGCWNSVGPSAISPRWCTIVNSWRYLQSSINVLARFKIDEVGFAMGKILVIEDDARILKALQRLFTSEGYELRSAMDGREGLELVGACSPDAVVLDLMLPGMSGRDICRSIKQSFPETPVIILSAISEVADKVLLLELGADDYVTKPFSPRELLARVQAAIRRTKKTRLRPTIAFGDVQVDFARMRATKNGRQVVLTAHEFKLLRFFIDNPERVLSREELLIEVWGYNSYPSTRTVDNQILKLRQKLEENPANPVHFCTVHGAGYRFVQLQQE
jgi:DNA-binding response OmpR family regulator